MVKTEYKNIYLNKKQDKTIKHENKIKKNWAWWRKAIALVVVLIICIHHTSSSMDGLELGYTKKHQYNVKSQHSV